MMGDTECMFPCNRCQVALTPYIAQDNRVLDANGPEVEDMIDRRFISPAEMGLRGFSIKGRVEKSDHIRSVLHLFDPGLHALFSLHFAGGSTQRILIDDDDLIIRQQVEGERIELVDRAADEHGGRQQSEHADFAVLFIRGESGRVHGAAGGDIAEHHHIRIVPMPGAVVWRPFIKLKNRPVEGMPAVADIRTGAVHIGESNPVVHLTKRRRIREAVDDIAT